MHRSPALCGAAAAIAADLTLPAIPPVTGFMFFVLQQHWPLICLEAEPLRAAAALPVVATSAAQAAGEQQVQQQEERSSINSCE
jgi:hypothetical protein